MNIQNEKPRGVVVIEGGVVQSVIADMPVDVTVIDYDTDGAGVDAETYSIAQANVLPPEPAYRSIFAAEVHPSRIDHINSAPLHFDYCAPVGELVDRWMHVRVTAPWPRRDARVLWRASFEIDGCPFEISHLVPIDSIEAATDIAKRCLDEIWPDQVDKLDQSFLPGKAVQS